MKFIRLFILSLVIISMLSPLSVSAQELVTGKEFAVQITAQTQADPPQVTLSWEPINYASAFVVYKRFFGDTNWGNGIAWISEGEALEYVDQNIQNGKIYEYLVLSSSEHEMTFNGVTGNMQWGANGYICTGVDIESVTERGRVLLLVDETMEQPLFAEIKRLIEDMTLEGWTVTLRTTPRAEEFDGDKVKQVKAIIREEYELQSEVPLQSVFLLGRVPVPYSGNMIAAPDHNYPPDGHREHGGAWPCDLYYGFMDETPWTDINTVDTIFYQTNDGVDTVVTRTPNKNYPGDGKFDFTFMNDLNKNVELEVGRVDLYDMPAFEKSEVELLKQYLDKNHAFRTGQIKVEHRGLLNDNFNETSYFKNCEAPKSQAYRNYGSLFGAANIDSVEKGTFLENLGNSSYMMAQGTSTGGFTSVSGVVSTNNYKDADDVNAVFVQHFGSYLGDWNVTNNVMRASLCTMPSVLTCCWTTRPHWYFHAMAVGKSIGYCAKVAQNNWEDYAHGYYYFIPGVFNQPMSSPYFFKYSGRMIHISLLGDPTLTLFTHEVPVVTQLTATQEPGQDIELNWEAPETDDVVFYNVYSSSSDIGGYTQLNAEPLSTTHFTDSNIPENGRRYMVRIVKPMTFNSGDIMQSGRGAYVDFGEISVDDDIIVANNISISPNPATTSAKIAVRLDAASNVRVDIYDNQGHLVRNLHSGYLSANTHSLAWDICSQSGQKCAPGVYYVRVNCSAYNAVEKLVVMP